MCLYTYISELSRMFQKLPGNFSETFLSRDELVITRFINMLHAKKIQFYGCKHVF